MRTTGVDGKFAVVYFDFRDFKSGVFTPAIRLPIGSLVLRGGLNITEASDGGGTDTLQVGTAADGDANLAATDAKAVANTSLTSLVVPSGVSIGITRTAAGAAPTKGKGWLWIEYLPAEASDFIVGDLDRVEEAVGINNRNVPR